MPKPQPVIRINQTSAVIFGVLSLLNGLLFAVPLVSSKKPDWFLLIPAAVFFVHAYACFTRQQWVRKFSFIFGIGLIGGAVIAIFISGIFNPIGAAIYGFALLRFYQKNDHALIWNGQEFTGASLRNYVLLILFIGILCGGVYAYFQYLASQTKNPARTPAYVLPAGEQK